MTPKNIPTVFVIFGATGDLMQRKITPALFHLYEKGKLPKMLRMIGVSRRPLEQEEFQRMIREILQKGRHDKEQVEKFVRLFSYQGGDFGRDEVYNTLAKELGRIDGEWKVCSNKLFYLAVPPNHYEEIFNNLHASGLTIPCGPDEGWTRVIVEKPFGRDLETAQRLDLLLGKLFKEEQIYRIDHYVGKEMLQNILSFRFSNTLLEEGWDNRFVEKIEIRLYEEGEVVPRRGSFYDGIGALRDVGQNHLLQMLAFVTMDNPGSFTTEQIRTRKAQVLNALERFSPDEVRTRTFRAQYKGYREIEGVAKNSSTETYFMIKAFLTSSRWAGVPIYLEAGKGMPAGKREIVVTFRHPSVCFCPPGAQHLNNKVVFSIEPEAQIDIHFLAKKPGLKMQIEERNFNFSYGKEDEQDSAQEYEKLLLDCIEGNQVLFISTEETKAEWEFIDPVLRGWEENTIPLVDYTVGSEKVIEEAQKHLAGTAGEDTLKKEIGVVGLGKMGGNIARSLLAKGWKVRGWNRTHEVAQQMESEGLIAAASLKELVDKLPKPRVVWMMLPAGAVVEGMLFGEEGLTKFLDKGDIVIDAGNSFYKDTVKNGERLKKLGINFIDVGTSGGPAGALKGASLMIGGDQKTFEMLQPLFTDIALPGGYAFFEGAGAGHFVKMVHNGIEYGMMQAIAEGFTILKKSQFKLDLEKVSHIYNKGSVVESRLTKWLEGAFQIFGPELKEVSGTVAHTGEGAWTVDAAKDLGVKAKIIEGALQFRIDSQKNPDYTGKLLSALRNMFGGHAIK